MIRRLATFVNIMAGECRANLVELLDLWRAAERMIREYGPSAEEECEARAGYHQMQHDEPEALRWRLIKGLVERLRKGDSAPPN